jgi:CubicO group peptidase (beta-lactamase class C family)
MTRRLRMVLAGLALLTRSAAAAADAPPAIEALATSLGRAFVANPVHVGLSIGIIGNGERHTFNFGRMDRRAASAPDKSTIYELASVTKSYSGMLLARAVRDGKLALDDDVRRYLPGTYPGLAYAGRPIRIADLASHTSGLPKNLPALPHGASPRKLIEQGVVTRRKFLQALRKVRLTCAPGSVYAYSNAGAQLAGIVLERVYGAPYEELVRRFITVPLRMPDTRMTVRPQDRTRYAQGHDGKGAAMPELSFWRDLPAAGFLKSTVSDQLHYLQWNLDESDPVVALAHRVEFRHTDERGDDIGLFWFANRTADGRRLIRHAGGSFGTTSFELLYPDANIGVVLLANDADASTEKALGDMADQLAGALAAARGQQK